MAIHAGWKGLAQDILAHAYTYLSDQGIPGESCHWAIGPCISQQSFEVGPELVDLFYRQGLGLSSEDLALIMMKGKLDRWHVDLASLALLRLKSLGVPAHKISIIRSDTRQNSQLWHSYRRDGVQSGRNWSWIERG